MKYTIVMPCFVHQAAQRAVIEQTLDSIKKNSKDYHLIIIDDGSTQNTNFLAASADTYVRQSHQGVSRSWNAGLELAEAQFVAVVNDDIRVPPGWLDALSETFRIPNCGVTGPLRGHFTIEPRLLPGPAVKNHCFFPGYCFMLKKSRFFEPFDEQFTTNCGDTDYWVRIEKSGLNLFKAPFQIWHQEGATIKYFDNATFIEESLALFYEKHGFNPQQEYYTWHD